MVRCPGKCYYMLIGNHEEPDKINLNGTEITCCNNEKLFGVLKKLKLIKKLNFDVLIKSLSKKAGEKLSALARLRGYLTVDQKLLLINLAMKSKCRYSPLI